MLHRAIRASLRAPLRAPFARGFSIQTVSPLPIGWAEHVLAGGHWGRALREYMRDDNHGAVVGVLNELLALPDNRVTLADERDRYGMPVARFDDSRRERVPHPGLCQPCLDDHGARLPAR